MVKKRHLLDFLSFSSSSETFHTCIRSKIVHHTVIAVSWKGAVKISCVLVEAFSTRNAPPFPLHPPDSITWRCLHYPWLRVRATKKDNNNNNNTNTSTSILVIATIIFYYYCSKSEQKNARPVNIGDHAQRTLDHLLRPALIGEDRQNNISLGRQQVTFFVKCRQVKLQIFSLSRYQHGCFQSRLFFPLREGNESWERVWAANAAISWLRTTTWLSWRHAKNTDEKFRSFLISHISPKQKDSWNNALSWS